MATKAPTLIFLTQQEAGQANVHLATISALLKHHPSAELHLCSFHKIEARTPEGVVFHQIPGLGHVEALRENVHNGNIRYKDESALVYNKPGFKGCISMLGRLSDVANTETPSRYIEIVHNIEGIINKVKPDLAIVDSFFSQATDACERLGQEYIHLSPNAWKDNAFEGQGFGAFAWPFMTTGWAPPLPWYKVVLNTICVLSTPIYLGHSSRHKKLLKARKDAGYTNDFPFTTKTKPILTLGTPALDWPGVAVKNLIPCGPILLPAPDIRQADPELASWLNQRQTILVSLGSHTELIEPLAVIIHQALDRLLTKRSDLQVLWKLRRSDAYELPAHDRIKIVEWLNADPISVLKSGRVVCSVHHGGSNSFHETLSSGVPHVVLSSWIDCHDFGAKVEWLGIGKWGNRNVAPLYDTDEVYTSLVAVVGDIPGAPSAKTLLARAEECAGIARRTGLDALGPDGESVDWSQYADEAGIEGRDVAAAWIIRKVNGTSEISN